MVISTRSRTTSISLSRQNRQITEIAQNLSIGNTNVSIDKRSKDDVLIEEHIEGYRKQQTKCRQYPKMAEVYLDIDIKVMSEHDVMAKELREHKG